MKLIHGWQGGKYVLVVIRGEEIVARISLKKDEAREVYYGIIADPKVNSENTYEGHEQIV